MVDHLRDLSHGSDKPILVRTPLFLDPKLFDEVQSALAGHNRPRWVRSDLLFLYSEVCMAGKDNGPKMESRWCTANQCGTNGNQQGPHSSLLKECLKNVEVGHSSRRA